MPLRWRRRRIARPFIVLSTVYLIVSVWCSYAKLLLIVSQETKTIEQEINADRQGEKERHKGLVTIDAEKMTGTFIWNTECQIIEKRLYYKPKMDSMICYCFLSLNWHWSTKCASFFAFFERGMSKFLCNDRFCSGYFSRLSFNIFIQWRKTRKWIYIGWLQTQVSWNTPTPCYWERERN